MLRCHAIQFIGFFIVLLHALTAAVQTAERISSKGIVFRHCFFIPFSRLSIVLLHAVSESIQLADAVLQIVFFLGRGFFGNKGMIRFCEPRLRLFFILFTAEAGEVHFSKIVHGKAVSFLGFGLHQGKGGIKIRRHLFCAIKKLTSLFILISPP